jgi:hypothetical protein
MTNERKPLFVNGVLDTTALTRKEFKFLLRVIDLEKVIPMLNPEMGPQIEMFTQFANAGLLQSESGYIGGGTNMAAYWMNPKYIPFFGASPEEFYDDQLNTRDLIGAMEIIYIVAETKGKASYEGFRVKIDKVERLKKVIGPNDQAEYSYVLLGKYPGTMFDIRGDWVIPDQAVEFNDKGTIDVKDRDGTPYTLEFKYVAPMTRDLVDKILDGRLGWKHDNTLMP